jgi:hypothetical protein
MNNRLYVVPKAVNLHSVPEHLEEGTRWSDAGSALSAYEVIKGIKGMPQLLRRLEQAASDAAATKRNHVDLKVRPKAHGPGRAQGSWVLAFLAFVISGRCDMQPWHSAVEGDPHFWNMCGFAEAPSYQAVWQCFTELESAAGAFNDAAALLIRRAHRQDPRVGAWWHFDASESETNATPRHDCMPGDKCPFQKQGRVSRVGTPDAAAMRRAETEVLAEVDEYGSSPDTGLPVAIKGTRKSRVQSKVIDHQRRGVRSFSNGHYWFTRDFDAGTRSYTSGRRVTKFWSGFYTEPVVDHFTGLPLAIHLFAADVSELKEYPVAFAKAERNVGTTPQLVGGDRGLSFREVFEHNTRRGVGSVLQFRRRSNEPIKAPASKLFDEHGVPACPHCGDVTDFVRFRIDGPKHNRPRLWVKCSYPKTDACEKEQAISCSNDWRRLLPVWRTHDAYQAMRQSHQRFEGKHQALRSNYLIAPNSYAIRPKRIGIAWQQLRANAALLIEWLRFGIQGGLRYLPVVETSGRAVRHAIAARRASLGLAGGDILPSKETRPAALKRPPGNTSAA